MDKAKDFWLEVNFMFGRVFKIGIILMTYCFIAALLLGVIQGITKPKIDAVNNAKKIDGMKRVLPFADKFIERKTSDGLIYYVGVSSSDTTKVLGYIVEAIGRGYSSDIVTLVGVDTTFKIVKINIMSQSETPGLGTKAVESSGGNEPPFQAQFSNKIADELYLNKDGGKIISITGATITSRAIVTSVRIAITNLKHKIREEE